MKTLFLLMIIFSVSCAHKKKIMDVNAVSMTRKSLEPNQKLIEIGEVESEFCPDKMRDQGSIGFLDTLVKSAQDKSGGDFITEVTVWHTRSGFGPGCLKLNGTAQKVAK